MSLAIYVNLIILLLLILIDRSHQLVYTHSWAIKRLREVGIKLAECGIGNATCVTLKGIHEEAIDEPSGIITLAKLGCPITIVGGTEINSSAADDGPMNKCSHSNGWRLNFLRNDCLDKHINESFDKDGAGKWKAGSGNIYIQWKHHWEVQYNYACERSVPSDSNYYEEPTPTPKNLQTELCKNSGGSCRLSSKHNNWCHFRDGLCGENEGLNNDIKCCRPKNRESCAQKGGNCNFEHSCDRSNSLIIPNICKDSPSDVICCVLKEGSQSQIIASLNDLRNSSNSFVNGANLLFLLLFLLIIVVLIGKWYSKRKVNFTMSSRLVDEESIIGVDDTKVTLIAGRFCPDQSLQIAKKPISKNNRIEIHEAWGNFANEHEHSIIIKMKEAKAATGEKIEEDYHNSFASEAEIHYNLEHPNIVKCFGCYELHKNNGKNLFLGIFMEKMECNLSELLDPKKEFANKEQEEIVLINKQHPIDICIQLTNAIVFIQSKRIVHADIAARNYLIKFEANGELIVKLSDFSLSKRLKKGEKRTIVGCVAHRWSPNEVHKDKEKHVSFESDIWSIGATFIEVFVPGDQPYNDWDPPKIREEQKKNNMTPLDYLKTNCVEKWENIPIKARSIMEKCFIIKPSERIKALDLLEEWKNY